MKLLLDTHILIWLLEGNQNLNPKVKQVIEDETNSLYISIVSLWEIAIKTSLNKLQLELPLEKIIYVLCEMKIRGTKEGILSKGKNINPKSLM